MPSSERSTSHDAASENTPLLATISPIPTSEPIEESIATASGTTPQHDEDAPLPKAQIFLLCYTRIVEPFAFFSIFPYINTMIEKEGGIDSKSVGFYSGLIESLFSLTQMCVMIFWGKAADRFGRKPCLIVSLLGVGCATVMFGMSKSLWQMVLFRCVAGVFSGTMVTVRAMISENSTKKTQAKAFSYFAFAGNLGIFFGPLLGGGLESPATKFPGVFGRTGFFHEYPYALPSFLTASIALSAAILTGLFVRETLHLHHSRKQSHEASMSVWELLKYPGVGRVLAIYLYIALLAFSFTAVSPVFLYTPIKEGGIGFQPELIAATIGLNGVSQALWLLLAFPPLHRRVGTGTIMRLCAVAWPFFFADHPLCHFFRRYGLTAAFWTVGPLSCILGSGVAMAFTAQQLAINDIAPTHETLGTLNSLALAGSSGLRSFVPALSTSFYATGIKYNIAGGQLFWILAVALAIGLTPMLRLLPAKAEGKPQQQENGGA